MVFWWGTVPEGAPRYAICGHLHLFPDETHMAEWLSAREDGIGFHLKLREVINYLSERPS